MQYEYEELIAKLKELGVTQEQIDEAIDLDGSLGLEDLANEQPQIENCDYLEEGQYYVKFANGSRGDPANGIQGTSHPVQC